MPELDPTICVAALYHFASFDDPAAIQRRLTLACAQVRGTLIVASEGINGTIAGTSEAVKVVLDEIRALPDCAALQVKISSAEAMPFFRMKVRVKPEIVTMGEPDIDPRAGAGRYVAPKDWNHLISQPNTILIDTRNDYEVAVGTFKNAIDPQTKTFREFPAWFRAQRDALLEGKEAPRVAMFCTGGIRCEKATAFLKSEGVEDVYHLEGGILKYLETVPEAESLWEGECFVFDQRVCLTHGLAAGSYELCFACRMPVSEEDKLSPAYQEGTSCPACFDDRDERRREGYAERHRQSQLARSRGEQHVGAPKKRKGGSE